MTISCNWDTNFNTPTLPFFRTNHQAHPPSGEFIRTLDGFMEPSVVYTLLKWVERQTPKAVVHPLVSDVVPSHLTMESIKSYNGAMLDWAYQGLGNRMHI